MLFMGGAFLLLFGNSLHNAQAKAIAEIEAIKAEVEATEKTNGYPTDFDNLLAGAYRRIEDGSHLAFVAKLDNENPFEENIIAVHSRKIIPQIFTVPKKGTTIKNPLMEATP